MKKLYFTLAILSIIGFYYIGSILVDNEMILPRINLIINYFKNLEMSVLFKHTSTTVFKATLSYLISIIISLVLAAIAFNKQLHQIINPYMSILKTLPTISIILILFIWFGNEKSIYMIPCIVIIPILYEAFLHQLKNIDIRLVEVSQVYRFNLKKRLKYLYYYPLLEGFMLSLKQTFGLCFKIIVMAEVIGQSQKGIGAIIQNEKQNFDMAGVFSWTILLIVLVLLFDYGLDRTSKKVLRWKGNT